MFLALSSTFNPHQAKPDQYIDFEQFTFPGGEPHIKILSQNLQDAHIAISIRLNSFEAVGRLLVAVDALKRMGIRSFELLLPYFPGARQDRLMVSGEPLTVHVYAHLINQLGAQKVTLFDPHSDVAPALLDRCEVLDNVWFVKRCLTYIGQPVKLVAPDGGALKKIYHLSQQLGGLPVVICSKHRDAQTGRLSGFEVHSEDLAGKACLIVDDICDGGGTFIGLAEKLKATGAGPLYLAVSHGIFSKGMERLLPHFAHVFTTDSISQMPDRKQVTQVLIKEANARVEDYTKCQKRRS